MGTIPREPHYCEPIAFGHRRRPFGQPPQRNTLDRSSIQPPLEGQIIESHPFVCVRVFTYPAHYDEDTP
jgi:hypothetical protein